MSEREVELVRKVASLLSDNVIRTHGGDELRFPGSALATIEDGRLRHYESYGDRSQAERAAGLV